MIEFEWEKKVNRVQAAAVLRELAQSLEGDGAVELEHDGWELKLRASDEIAIEVELEVEDGEIELEIELKWSAGPQRPEQPADEG
jgi:amphi-Trp domain-containing protein